MPILLKSPLLLFSFLHLFTLGTTLPGSAGDSTALLSAEIASVFPSYIPPNRRFKPIGQYLFVDVFNTAYPSINYEFPIRVRMSNSYRLRFNFGVMPSVYQRKKLLEFGGGGLGISRIGHRRIRRSEIGLGLIGLFDATAIGFAREPSLKAWSGIQGIVGYRWEWNRGAFFRVAMSPSVFMRYPNFFFAPLAGISFGWRIRKK